MSREWLRSGDWRLCCDCLSLSALPPHAKNQATCLRKGASSATTSVRAFGQTLIYSYVLLYIRFSSTAKTRTSGIKSRPRIPKTPAHSLHLSGKSPSLLAPCLHEFGRTLAHDLPHQGPHLRPGEVVLDQRESALFLLRFGTHTQKYTKNKRSVSVLR